MEDNQQNSSDVELLDELRKGRNEAATELYRRHDALLRDLIVHSLRRKGCMSPQDHAEDVNATAWINILSHIRDLKDASHFSAWVTHIARNVAREHLMTCHREQPDDESSKVEWVLVLNANLDDIDEKKTEAIVEHLRRLSGDTTLNLKNIKSGSIILKLDGSREGFKIIESLYKEGKLTELLGLTVKQVAYEAAPSNHNRSINIFFSYCHRDEELRDQLATHLSVLEKNNVISGWYDRQINAGEEWETQIDERMNAASIILLLISSDFIASGYCWDVEVKRAMERHEAGEAYVIPVILRPVNWKRTPFGKLQALPKDAKPVTKWKNRDEAFLNISKGIEVTVNSLISKSK